MADFEEFMKNLKGGGGSAQGYDVDDELAAMENEVKKEKGQGGKGKKPKKNSDDLSLSDLENEDDDIEMDDGNKGGASDDELDKLSDDDELDDDKKKPDKKPSEPSKPQPAQKEQPKTKEQPKPTNTNPPPSSKVTKQDIYLESSEKIYHDVRKMKSMGVLENEKKQCEEIIKYKKDNGYDDYDIWEGKIDLINCESTKVTNYIESGVMDLDGYKKYISQELEYEKKLLEIIEKDKKAQPFEVPVIKQRIQKRIDIITEELNQNPAEQEDEEVEEVKQQEEETKKEEPKEIKMESAPAMQKSQTISGGEKPKPKEESKPTVKEDAQVDEVLLRRVNIRFNEYKSAIEYFKNNGLTKQQEDAILKAKKILEAIKKIQAKQSESVDEFSLPNPITPEYIYGYSKEERLEKYKVILTEFIRLKNEIKQDVQKIIEKLKTMSKKDVKKIEGAAKKDLDEKNAKIAKYDKLIELLKEQCKKPWIPAPLYSKTTEEVKYEKINANIPLYTMVITFGKSTYDKDKIYLYLVLNYSDKTKTEYVYPKSGSDFESEIKWAFDKSEFKHLWRKSLEIQLYHKKFFGSKLKGSLKLNLTALKSQCEISGSYDIELLSKRLTPKIDIAIKLRTPFMEPEFISKPKEVFEISKLYPEFKIDTTGGAPFESSAAPIETGPKKPETTAQPKKQTQPQQPTQTSQNKPQQQQQTQQPQQNKTVINKSNFRAEELKDPDIVDNLNSMEVINYKLAELEKKIKEISGRTPKSLKDKLIQLKCKKNVLEESLGDTIDPPKYVVMMKNQLEHDKLLFQYFMQEKDEVNAALVKPRITYLMKEIKETEDYLKGKK